MDGGDIREAAQFSLPSNYDFELEKTVRRIREEGARHVGLQFPEGLLTFSLEVGSILEAACEATEFTVLGDVTYGACCIDDLTCDCMGIDFLVHYGHSCLLPIVTSAVKCLYVFVHIHIDCNHFVDTVAKNFFARSLSDGSTTASPSPVAFMATVQFTPLIHAARRRLIEEKRVCSDTELLIPQCRPLTAGESLGCTSPKLPPGCSRCVFVADGRFHLESAMIHNPEATFCRYDPFTKRITHEQYDHGALHGRRFDAIARAREAQSLGVIVSTLGRQGSITLADTIITRASPRMEICVFLISELTPDRFEAIAECMDAFVQVACPRLSTDWGHSAPRPLLNSYEALVAFGGVPMQQVYPMDYYATDGGPWRRLVPRGVADDVRRRLLARAARQQRE